MRIFLGVFMVAAITTTMLGMGGTLGFAGLRQSLGLESAADQVAMTDWGELRWVHVTSRIRSDRSTDSQVVGRLAAGSRVKVDFAADGWYAVFLETAADRVETEAIGYVYGNLLKEEPPPDVEVPLVRILP